MIRIISRGLAMLALLCFMNHVLTRLEFLEAWSKVKKLRVDRLEKAICDEP